MTSSSLNAFKTVAIRGSPGQMAKSITLTPWGIGKPASAIVISSRWPSSATSWRNFDLRLEISKYFDFPVYLGNDATSACGAELTLGGLDTAEDFLYIYIGYFIGGGIVLNGSLFTGKSGNAGALGPFLMQSTNGNCEQLVERASLISLERQLARHRNNPDFAMTSEFKVLKGEDEIVEEWLEISTLAIAHLVIGACSVIDFPMVVIDGKMPSFLKARALEKINSAVDSLPSSGIFKPDILPGTLGEKARALGAASLPLARKFMLEIS